MNRPVICLAMCVVWSLISIPAFVNDQPVPGMICLLIGNLWGIRGTFD